MLSQVCILTFPINLLDELNDHYKRGDETQIGKYAQEVSFAIDFEPLL